MAVNKTPKLAKDFWPRFIKKQIFQTIIIQLIIFIGVEICVYLFGELSIINKIYLYQIMAGVGGIMLIGLALNICNITSTTKPTKDLIAAILKTSDEKTVLTAPNPNEDEYITSGMSDALKMVYELSSKQEDKVSQTKNTLDNQRASALTSALDMTTCGVVAMDKNRRIIYANRSVPMHVDAKGIQMLNLIFNGKDTLDAWLNECAEKSVHAEHTWKRIPDCLPNEENRHFFDVIASYEKGSAVETVLMLVDRTKGYIVDEENLDFISFAAHELRGPITVISGYLDVLLDELKDVLQGDQQELFHRLIVSSNRLSGYIDNILNTSKYDRRHFKMSLSEESVADIYDTISDDMKLRAGAQNRLLVTDISRDLPKVAADSASMSEVFGNLIDNAIKYSNEGGTVTVTAKANGDFVDISVIDKGIGMPESVVSNLFQKFYRSFRSRETVAGTGIGLYISKAIVESHGGTISVRSQDGMGSTFTVSLPIYDTVADKLKAGDNSNKGLISEGTGWIKNHSMYRG